MSSWNRTCVLVMVVVTLAPATAFAQGKPGTITVDSPHRPWVGFTIGKGFVGGDHIEADDSWDVGVTVDIPLKPTARIRVAAGRLAVNGASFGEFPLRRFALDAVALVPVGEPRRPCQSHFVIGGGAGLYHFGLDDFSATRPGYQLFAGGECVDTRISIGINVTGRSIHPPDNIRLSDRKLFSLDMQLFFRLRL